jgi:hypothetical protein
MVLCGVLVLVIARASRAGLWGLCLATARRLLRALPRLAPLLTPQRRED